MNLLIIFAKKLDPKNNNINYYCKKNTILNDI